MNIQELKNFIDDCQIDGNKICITKNLYDVLNFIKNKYSFDLLKSITAVDFGDDVELIYNLFSIKNEDDVIISIKVKDETESVTDLYESAKADENEIYDMFGIKFIGNEDLKRLYMPEGWEGYPLRKDYIQNDTRLAWNDDCDNA